jgi:hypothetical protein
MNSTAAAARTVRERTDGRHTKRPVSAAGLLIRHHLGCRQTPPTARALDEKEAGTTPPHVTRRFPVLPGTTGATEADLGPLRERVQFRSDDAIALTGDRLEAAAIDDRHPTTPILDEPHLL